METNQLLQLSPSNLRRAAELKERIDALNSELASLLGGTATSTSEVSKGGRRMSAESRRRIAEAARLRWAKVRAAKGGKSETPSGEKAGAKKRRTMSAAARAKIAAAARARWAKVRAAKG